MSELRDILRNATQHTLVLGDELCAGTESISAQALVASGIQWLSTKQAKFIFATHLHNLPNVIDVKKEGVEVWHLHVEYDPLTKKLVYDRSLKPGNGSTLYGLEVARAMDLPFEFIEQALKNRHRIMGSTAQDAAVSSSWNQNIVRKECEICKHPITKDLEVHHVQHRASATQGILANGTTMNDQRNLMVICQKCHDEIHADKVEVGQLQMTSDGPERIIHIKDDKKEKEDAQDKRKGKWLKEELETITDTLKQYTSTSLKAIKNMLYSKHNIDISESMLGKMKRSLEST
jgi:DNA mismatch repair protein MutS